MIKLLENVNILHVEDNAGDAILLSAELSDTVPNDFRGHEGETPLLEITRVKNCAEAKAKLTQGKFHVVILDLGLPDGSGLEALREIASAAPDLPIIVLSGRTEPKTAFELIQGGAQDYLVKGQANGPQIWRAIRFALERQHVRNHETEVLGQSQEGFKALMDISIDGVAVFRNGVIRASNSAFEKILGYGPDEIIGKPITSLCDSEYRSYFQSQIERGSPSPMVIYGKKKDGASLSLEFTIKPCLFEGVPAHVINVRDVTEHKKHEENIHQQAYLDPGTGMPNRYLFYDRLNVALQQADRVGGKVGLMFLDLDRFKLINDTLGHHVGDELIKAVALRLESVVRKSDTIARLGGDEFTVLVNDVQGLEEVSQLARKILETMAKPFQLQRHELHISASIGISLYPDDAPDAGSLVQRSDMAMYQAKEKGRNNFQAYHASMNISNLERLELENNLFKAMDADEFDLFYQPQLELATGRVVGLEALLRWNHPTHGPISPSDFVPLAEETGLIIPLGQWVIRKACIQAKAWQDQGIQPVRISVNLSAVQFLKHTLPFLIDKILKEVGLDPKHLEFEITESVAMRNPAFTLAVLREFTEIIKVRIALDDFGIAYSSLGYLKNFPIHCLKIDKSFITGLGQGKKDEAIVTAIIVLAKNLGLEVVAEGVETKAQMDFLRQQGDILIQGYFVSPPLSAREVEVLLRKQG
jgi:diguanylate cyclase (GGDEF)-like protein/PAS domain S-box-containing protein